MTAATSPQNTKRGVSLATLAFVAMLMVGQTAPMEYIRDASLDYGTVSYDTVYLDVPENTDTTVTIDLASTVSNAENCKMYASGVDDKDNLLFSTPVSGTAFVVTMAPTALDYENPLDADGDNTFQFDVKAVCPGNVASTQTYSVNITNTVFAFDGPATATVAEDAASGDSVWSTTSMDDTTDNCAITAGDDDGHFDIDAETCAITVSDAADLDFETEPSITLTVTASTFGALESDTMDVAVSVTDVDEAPVGDLVITGTLTEGEVVTADSSGVSDEDGIDMSSAAYQWYSGSAAIAGATASTYTLANSDTGQAMQVSMTYNDDSGRSTTLLSAASAEVTGIDDNDPASTTIPDQAVLEDASTDIDVSSYFSDDDPDATLTYSITGAGFATIDASTGIITATPTQAEVGDHTVTVTATDDDPSDTTTSQSFNLAVVNVNDDFSLGDYSLAVFGDVHDGSELSLGYVDDVDTTECDSGGWINDDLDYTCTITVPDGASMTFSLTTYYSYLWASGSLTTPSGTTVSFPAYTYGLSGDYGPYTEAGDYVFTLGADPGYNTASVYATITESTLVELATDSALIVDGDGLGTLAYQWYADGIAIDGATLSTFTPDANDLDLIGTTYSVEISQTDGEGTEESMMSSSSDALTLNPAGDLDGDGTTNDVDTDVDGDGTDNDDDAFPLDDCADTDTDGDGDPDDITADCTTMLTEDSDDDDDGTPDVDDAFPIDETEDTDADGDEIGANTDQVENDACYSIDTDGDGFPDQGTGVAGCTPTLVEDSDDDGDGITNTDDCNVSNATQMYDTDGDGVCNSVDDDDDDDGVPDWYDDYPLDDSAQYDADGDGFSNTIDADDDNDGVTDNLDDDTDGDGYNNTDQGDGIVDWRPDDPDEWVDTDGDGLGDNYDTDDDDDDVLDVEDGCPLDDGASLDSDGDGHCDATTDDDDDDDGVLDVDDAFPLDPHASVDTDGDGDADSIDPNLPPIDVYTTVELCSMTLTSTPQMYFNNYEAISCTSTVPSEVSTVTVTLTYGNSWASETALYVLAPGATSYDLIYSGSNSAAGTTETLSYTAAGDYVLYLIDTWGDGCAGCLVTLDYDYISDSSPAEVTPLGTELDFDDDDDGTLDVDDAFPLDECADTDTDGDGDPDDITADCTTMLTEDSDDDDDGTPDADDDLPLDATEDNDNDDDGTGDNADTDDDDDNVLDVDEETGCEMVADCDDDGVNDDEDAFPLDDAEDTDTDGDGIGDNADIDDDNDGVSDDYDDFPLDSTEWRDFDGDGVGDAADDDDDDDGVLDSDDAFPLDDSESADTDGDGMGDNTDSDDDGDGVDDHDSTGAQLDNCRTTVNANQDNNDGDAEGDLCDDDDDNDGTDDDVDAFPMSAAGDTDTDGDGMPDELLDATVTETEACTVTNTADVASADCSGTIATAGETLTFTLVTANTWASDLTVTASTPNGDVVTLAERDLDVGMTYTWSFEAVGDYTLTLADFYSDGGDDATHYLAGAALSETLTGVLATPDYSSDGLTLDLDDDDDGYSDVDEASACAGDQAYSGYESTSDPLDSASTPADMDGDLICDGLDMDRDGDGDVNYDYDGDGSVNYLHGHIEDVFPDDPAEMDDNDDDGTGDNADTDDDNDMWTDALENTCSGSHTDGYSNQYNATSLPDDYDGDMDCDTFDIDDDNDGVNDGPDPHPLDECYWSDNDLDGIADYNDEGGCVAHMTSFESGMTGGLYYDYDYNTTHDLVNNAGQAEVNYDGPASYKSASACPEGYGTPWVVGAGSCTVTVARGGYAEVSVYWPYYYPYITLESTSPSNVVTNLSSTPYGTTLQLTEAGDWTFSWTDDGTWNAIALIATSYTPFELGYQASWAPSGNTGTGLSDGDLIGVTDDVSVIGSYLDGLQGYRMSDTDGLMTLTLDAIDPAGLTAVVSYYVQSASYSSLDSMEIRFVGDTSTVILASASALDLRDMAGSWATASADISDAGVGSLEILWDSNSAFETLYIDNVYFTTSYQVLDSDDDNDGRLDGYDWCPLDPTEQDDFDQDGICDDQDLDDDNDGVFDFNDEFPYDGSETVDADGDGIGDNADTDDDNDGVTDDNDALPFDPDESLDSDGDGVGDNADTDDDNDGVLDDVDVWPLDNTMAVDTDMDGIADVNYTVIPGELETFETGGFTLVGWTTTSQNPMDVRSSGAIAGSYSLKSTNQGAHGSESSYTLDFPSVGGGDFSFLYSVSSESGWDYLEVYINGQLVLRESGEVTALFSTTLLPGNYTVDFIYDKDFSVSLGDDTAWIDNVQLPTTFIPYNMDTDDDNDGVLDEDDLQPLDPCVASDLDGDGEYDNLVGVNGGGLGLDGSSCSAGDYLVDSNDDNDAWSDVDEIACGTDPMDDSDYPADFDGDLSCDLVDPDDDNDGTADDVDAFPMDPYESSDLDVDGIGDNADPDDDGDGYLDGADAFPTDGSEWVDYDGDGIGDNADTDDDGDGVADDLDAFPLDETETTDSDGDGFGDNIDPDDDDDGVLDDNDSFPNDSTEAVDSDGDGIGDVQDDDDDGDGVLDADDAFPLDPTETLDFDGDGIGDNTDSDIDNDGYSNSADAFDFDASEWGDADGDGIGDNTDSDNDNDGVADELDAFPYDPSETNDLDGDGIGDNTDTDDDGDSYGDDIDAFPTDDTEWLDTDGDGTGNNEDSDDDGDGFSDANEDSCGTDTLSASDVPPDYDGDGICDALDSDVDIVITPETPQEDELGFGAAVPGFPTALAALALLGAAMVAGRRSEA